MEIFVCDLWKQELHHNLRDFYSTLARKLLDDFVIGAEIQSAAFEHNGKNRFP